MFIKSLPAALLTTLCFFSINVFACDMPAPEYPNAEAPDGMITDAELRIIRERVLNRCELSSKLADNKLPWYFHYENGVELLNKGSTEQAIEPLQMTANLRTEAQRGTRMYGMLFVNYLPYFQMSLAYSELGQWDKAWEALQMSEQQLEFVPHDTDYYKFASLKSLINEHRHSAS
jgi:tetratricopeptide (TPR) repeat protein